jgi:cation transport ATPase
LLYARSFSLDEAFVRALTVLVISCPCALGIAIPLARVAAVALAARKGILIQDFEAFDRAEKIDTVVIDKTGTMTRGNWRLEMIHPQKEWDEEQVLGLAAGLEAGVDHAVATEIQHAARRRHVEPYPVTHREISASGVTGLWQSQIVHVGARAASDGHETTDMGHRPPGHSAETIISWVYLTVNGELAATLGFGDRLKSSARKTAGALRARGYDIVMVSGDAVKVTRKVGRQLGVDCAHGNMRPEDKAQLITEIQTQGHMVAMLGDGVNDAPALVSADIGLALFAGRNLGKEAQTVTLMRGDPHQMIDFIDFAGRVRQKIMQNLAGAFIYNLVSIPVAMAGWLSPLVAVGAMLLSSLSVTGNTLLLLRSEGCMKDRQQP